MILDVYPVNETGCKEMKRDLLQGNETRLIFKEMKLDWFPANETRLVTSE